MRHWLGVLVVASLAAGPLEAQGLGEAAAKEKRRREEEQKKNKGPAKVITTEDLTKVTATTANAGAPGGLAQDAGARPREDTTPADETRREGASTPGGGEGPGGQDEKSWRTQAAELRKEIQAAEQKAASVQQENDRLFAEIQRSTDTNEILRLRAEQNKVSAELEIAKKELANLRQEWTQFEESARRAGVPPGWIR